MTASAGHTHESMPSWLRIAALALVLPALLLGPLAAPSLAQGRHGLVERSPVQESFDSGSEEPDPFWLDQCGVRVRHAGSVTGVRSVFRDGTMVLRTFEQHRWWDFDSGKLLLTQKDREVLTETPVSETVDEAAGTRTVVLDVDYVGVPLRLMEPRGGVVLMSAGRLERTVTLVFDLGTGELLTETVEVDRVAGQWPFLGPEGNLQFAELTEFACEHLTS